MKITLPRFEWRDGPQPYWHTFSMLVLKNLLSNGVIFLKRLVSSLSV